MTSAAHAEPFGTPWFRALSRRSTATPSVSRSLDDLLRAAWTAPHGASPELVKVYGFIEDEVSQAGRLLALRRQHDRAVEESLRAALDAADVRTTDRGWDVLNVLKRLNLRIGDRSYISGLLEYETAHMHDPRHWHTWDEHFSTSELRRLRDAYRAGRVKAADRAAAIDRLTTLYRKRAEAGRNRRAQVALKEIYLNRLALALLALLVLLGVSADLSAQPSLWREFTLAVFAGALGSTLSGVLKLRDHLVRLDELRAFRPAMRVQPLVGASAAALAFLLLANHSVPVTTFKSNLWSSPGVLGFIVGFSEPFFLGLVDRVAVIPDRNGADPPASKPRRKT